MQSPIIPSFLNRRKSNYVGLTQINVYRKKDFMVKKYFRFARRVGLLDQFGGPFDTGPFDTSSYVSIGTCVFN